MSMSTKVNQIISVSAAMLQCQSSRTAILEAQLDTPIGLLSIKSCEKGLHSISHQSHVSDENFAPNNEANLSVNPGTQTGSSLETKAESELLKSLYWLQSYFSSKIPTKLEKDFKAPQFCLPSDESTEFEREVWLTLFQKTNSGDTVTYKDLAELVGRPNAARAVGTALKKNPIPIIIPCHRVIRSNGSLGNYSGGTKNKMKEFLIQMEQKHFAI